MITQSIHQKQLGSGQDYVQQGYIDRIFDSFHYIIVADGHGRGELSKRLMLFNWHKILINDTPKKLLADINKNILLRCPSLYRDGATISIAKIFTNKIQLFWMGDSQIHLKINDTYFKSLNHNAYYTADLERYSIPVINLSNSYKIYDENNLIMVDSLYCKFKNNQGEDELLAMTRSLGHEFLTPQQLDFKEFEFDKSDKVDLLIASDGLWDMIYEDNILNKYNRLDAIKFTELAETRWNKTWNLITPKLTYPNFKPTDPDDISVAVFYIN